MAEHVISHRQPRRKRGARRPALRRFGAFIVTVAALGTASWLAPRVYRPEPVPHVEVAETPARPPKLPPSPEDVKVFTLAEAPAPAVQPRPRLARRTGVPLDVRPVEIAEDFEILTAAELDAISQARN